MAIKKVTPPIASRGRGPSVDMQQVQALADASKDDWATDDELKYASQKEAQMGASKFKRWVQTVNEDMKVRTRIWQDGKEWVWALRSEKA